MRVLAALCLMLTAAPALAEERTPAQRQQLIELARTLGEAHALRSVCEGRSDQRWRNRMQRVNEIEQAETAFQDRLVDSFNAGFQAQEATHVTCDARARSEIAAVARRGRDLAAGLAEARVETASAR